MDTRAVDSLETKPDYRWTLRALQEQLGVVLEQLTNPLCILLDGLDEYLGDKWDMADFLLETAASQVKLCIASRPDMVFEIAFKNTPIIKMQEWNSPAIDKMVTLTIQRSLAKGDFYSDDTVVELAKGVSKKAHGVFLRARFAVNELREGWSAGLTLAEIKKSLKKVPDELEDIYARILKNLKPEQRQEAAYLLQLVCYAKRTLTLDELYVAMAHAAGGQDLHIKQISEREIERFEEKDLRSYWRCTRGVSESRIMRVPGIL